MVSHVFNKKLFRDLLSIKAQIFSISLVVGLGIAVFFGFTSTHQSMKDSRDKFYVDFYFADLFANVKKAPQYVANEVSDLDGVAALETRIEQDALMSIPGFIDPGVVHFVSLPDGKQPRFNKIYLFFKQSSLNLKK